MEWMFKKVASCIGKDNSAYLSWSIGNLFWVGGFVYVT
jgi:hypothetical protein